ncbi:ABC transporter ATP-binding protein [Saccharococcus caldoxylosilyticus]|uniref:Putative ABC transporter ATP-binding protein n=1 Tax=Parageobacillus caldoxylosilyticus NBRC 107762 TaxID=1220594 RepID=A0A023DAE1_9BACL|nr:ABC transporter ATP-binding protein [Parageobacillus caldoxylosilyticus]OQP01501.1 bacitracin ABC transporter ATP-binding protein [Geobacillus sp. 44B]MBB3850782.1 ABC-2 type transport system ATP-binding protein [Parageobacillus caldoxylosilyticus]QNU39395.1 ABC transporter ATP-binding protein [Geobacillus sp. 44B]QXJ39269.1 putative ABC transporter ATP-binding protein YxlF [Parageobacillus caldoxylosilyticus]GAJ38324.1 putative ABC transporter ATP-binding protein [Parageobacillus caldoxylo
MNPLLQLKNVRKDIGKKTIIHDLSLEVFPGEVFGFLGPNGAGKTTTIRMIVGLMGITSGDVLINGISIQKDFEKAIQHVGAIVENPEMYKFLTGYQNLLHYARMTKGVTKERIDEVVKLVGLEKRIHDKVKTYSLGMRQRLGLAQALLHRPSLLILDEPTNGLDPAGIREIRDYLRKLAKEEGLGIIVSSHLLSEMEMMCDRFAIIQHGRLVGIESVQELSKQAQKVLLTVKPVEQALTVIKNIYPHMNITSAKQGIEVSIDYEEIPSLNAALVSENIKVYGIQVLTKSLEERFLEMTGGNEIA